MYLTYMDFMIPETLMKKRPEKKKKKSPRVQHSHLSLGKDLLDISNGLSKNLLLELVVTELLVNLGNDGLSKSLLLSLSDLGLVSHPRVKNRLGLSSKVNLLLKDESLSLELSSLLGDGKEGLGDGDNILGKRDGLNALLDGEGVGLSGLVKDLLDVGDVSVGPLLVGGGNGLGGKQNKNTENTGNTGLSVDNVKTVRDGVDTGSSGSGEDTGLGDNVATRKSSKDRRSLLLGVLLSGVEADKRTVKKIKRVDLSIRFEWESSANLSEVDS